MSFFLVDFFTTKSDSFVFILWRHLTFGRGVAFLWKECDIQEVSYKLVIYIRISKILSNVLSITNKINNFHRDTRVPLPDHAFFLIHTRSRDNHQSS